MSDSAERLAAAHVVVIGAGGLGALVAGALARAGVGTISIVDPRSQAAWTAEAAVRASAPAARVLVHELAFAPGTSFDLLLDADLVVDATGDRAARYLANDAATIRGIPFVWGEAPAEQGRLSVALEEVGIDYRDLEPESDDRPAAERRPGPLRAAARAAIGGMMAAEAVKLLTGDGDPLIGRVARYDARTGRLDETGYTRKPGAPRPGSLEERTALPQERPGRTVAPEQLAAELAGPQPPQLVDVREAWEAERAALPGARLIPLGELPIRAAELDRHADIVIYCHHGVRSARALEYLEQLGFERVRHLTGGIDAYSTKVDPSVPRY